ncbi:MAG: lysophospholipid acyltransferase family protein [Flavobacteriales bacterium]|nr:lysophospholipid acyltransferase family protein [Flavobacteriales bacterium]
MKLVIGSLRTVLSVLYSAFWCGTALITLIIFPNSSEFLLIKFAKKYWSEVMMKWIVGAELDVQLHPETEALFKSGRGAVLVSNHSSYLDINLAFASTPTPIVFIAKAGVKKVPLLGGANERVGTVFVERGNINTAKKAIKKLEKTLKNGRCVLVYPEGSRFKTDEIQPFKKGGFHLASNAGAPVVPVYHEGMGEILPPHTFIIRKPSKPVVVRFGKPIYSSNLEELRDKSFESVKDLQAKLKL